MRSLLIIKRATLYCLLAILPVAICVATGVKSYEIWDQVTYYWLQGQHPSQLLSNFSSHALRYTILYPVFMLSDFIGVDYDSIFSIIVVLALFATLSAMDGCARLLRPEAEPSFLRFMIFSAPIIALFLGMNGRGAVAFVGYASTVLGVLSISQDRRIGFGHLTLILFGLLFSSVSSGAFVSAFLVLVSLVWLECMRAFPKLMNSRAERHFVSLLLLAGLTLVLLGGFLFSGIKKNLDFYGGGVEGAVEMLNHGVGKYAFGFISHLDIRLVIVFAFLLILIGSVFLLRRRNALMYFILLSSLFCGVFGYTTLALSVIPILILARHFYESRVFDMQTKLIGVAT